MKITTPHKRTIYVGDIHGQFKTLIYELKRLDISDALVVCLGDISLGFNKTGYYIQTFNYMQKHLEKLNNTVVFLRGNHDNPEFFEKDKIGKLFNNIIIASDYTIIEQNGINSLIIGGGISMDRYDRTVYKTYWADEDIEYDEKILSNINNISIVLSHIAPIDVWPLDKPGLDYWKDFDDEIYVDEIESRQKLKNIIDKLKQNGNKITNVYHGHYHETNIDSVDNIEYRCVEMNKLYEPPHG